MEIKSMEITPALPVSHQWHFTRLYLHVEISGALVTTKNYRGALAKHMAKLSEKNGRKMLVNSTGTLTLSQEDQFFTSFAYIPDMVRNGLKFIAVVAENPAPFEQLLVHDIQDTLQADVLETRFFDSVHEAEAWLDTL